MTDYDIPWGEYPAPPTANDLWLHDMRRQLIEQRYEAALARHAERVRYVDPAQVWLGIANGILQAAVNAVNIRRAIAESELGEAAA